VGIVFYFASLEYFWFRELKSKYFKRFYYGIFVFIMVIIGIEILPLSITNNLKVHLGIPPIVFEVESPIQSIKKAMQLEWTPSPQPPGL
jgi:hypothetical protein